MGNVKTNASSDMLAMLLKDARVGTFTGLITTKRGVERGPKGNKVVYGNDRIHTVIFTGFRYEKLVERSLAALKALTDADVAKLVADGNGEFTEADVRTALAEQVASFEDTLNPDTESKSTTAGVFEPLVVNGETVRGGRVYRCSGKANCRCRDCSDEARAPKPGTIYVQGLRIFSKVLEPAPNGPAPKANSKPKTLAKKALTRNLPTSRYVSYRLEPGTDFILRAGGTAAVEACQQGFIVNDSIIGVLDAAS